MADDQPWQEFRQREELTTRLKTSYLIIQWDQGRCLSLCRTQTMQDEGLLLSMSKIASRTRREEERRKERKEAAMLLSKDIIKRVG